MADDRIELAKNIADSTNYLNKEIIYLKNTAITEYDISSAGFTVIKFKKLLPESEIAELEKLSKMERNIRIGKKILLYPNISKEILETLAKARKAFVVVNGIHPEDILSIKKDAFFLIKKIPTVLTIKDFQFRQKDTYTSYCYLNRKEFYYSAKTDELVIKGISDKVRETQNDYLLKDIKKFMSLSEKVTSEQMFSILKTYRQKYLERKLNKETYRDLDTGMFKINDYLLENIADDVLLSVDTSQNYINYLVPLFNMLV